MWLCLSPVALFQSLQYSTVFYPMMLTCIMLAWKYDQSGTVGRNGLFVICGIQVAYLDILTYPLAALGVPLILVLTMDSGRHTLKENLWMTFRLSASWGVGYGGMWVSKWIITSLISGENVVADAMGAVTFRTSHAYGDIQFNWLGVVQSNLDELLNLPVLAVFVLTAIAALSLLLRKYLFSVNTDSTISCSHTKESFWGTAVPIGVVCIYPFIWYMILMNHSGLHYWMTYRNLVITVYGIISICFLTLDGNRTGVAMQDPSGIAKGPDFDGKDSAQEVSA